jgi:uncharacterized membrane protein HdeD (DUF308 family)
MSRLVPFLLGVIAMSSLVAGAYFVKFWRGTRDTLFLAFAAFFLIEAANRTALAFFARPNEGSPWIYIIRLLALLGILTAILHKNYGGSRR